MTEEATVEQVTIGIASASKEKSPVPLSNWAAMRWSVTRLYSEARRLERHAPAGVRVGEDGRSDSRQPLQRPRPRDGLARLDMSAKGLLVRTPWLLTGRVAAVLLNLSAIRCSADVHRRKRVSRAR